MYPAAYDSVVAVTAVDAQGQIFRLANRGEYLDLAAPGVSMLHAKAGGGYAASSGTSFAVPFAATAAARIRQLMPGEDALEIMHRNAQDLGTPGWDEVYGYGLLRPNVLVTSGAQTASR
jgi:subtilisin family serine protease